MQSETKTLKELIELQTAGKCSHEEERLLLDWFKQLKLHDGVEVDEATGILLKQQIDLANGRRQPVIRKLQFLKYAAACLVLVGAFASVWYFKAGDKVKETTQSAVVTGRHIKFKRLINASSKPVRITLEDGSVVALQRASSMLWQVPFSAGTRKIELVGKAFFKVAKNKEKPFVVYSGAISTTALGTSFWIDQYKNSGQIEVKLITGKVLIKNHSGPIENTLAYLVPGQKLNYVLASNTATVYRPQKLHQVQGLNKVRSAQIQFDNTPLREVFARLETYYGVKIRCTTPVVKTMTFYGTYTGDDQVENILNTIVSANELRISRTKNTFIISK